MTLRARSCAAALITVGLALYTESAHADAAESAGAPAAPSCRVSIASPGQSTVTLPANAPALLLSDQSEGNDPTVEAALVNGTTRTGLTATTDANGLWALSLPTASATAGTYSVEIAATCPNLSVDQKVVTSLTLTAPVAFPTSVGSLVHVPTNPPTGIDKIRLQPTPGMTAFLPAAQLQISVDGATARKISSITAAAPIELTVNTGTACVENGALHREKRVVRVTLEGAIAGVAESPAPASIDVPIDCGAIKWTSGLGVDKDGRDTTTGGTDALMPTVDASSDGGGCNASRVTMRGRGEAGGVLAFALGGLGMVAMRRRRRR